MSAPSAKSVSRSTSSRTRIKRQTLTGVSSQHSTGSPSSTPPTPPSLVMGQALERLNCGQHLDPRARGQGAASESNVYIDEIHLVENEPWSTKWAQYPYDVLILWLTDIQRGADILLGLNRAVDGVDGLATVGVILKLLSIRFCNETK